MATSKFNGDLLLRILVGILFVVIGIEGIAGFGGNSLYDELDDVFEIIVGVVLLVAGLLLIVPAFVSGIKGSFVKVSTLVVLAAWIIFIFLDDFVFPKIPEVIHICTPVCLFENVLKGNLGIGYGSDSLTFEKTGIVRKTSICSIDNP